MPTAPLAAHLRDAQILFSAGTVAGLNDDELLRRFTARRDVIGEVAFAALVARHGAMVLAACRRTLTDEHEAEDAFQATFLVLARRAASVRGGTLGPWLYGVALRVARRARADSLRCRTKARSEPTRLRLIAEADTDAASAAERAELAAVVDEELARLSGRDRAPLLLCDLGGLTHEQAAEQLGWPVGTVKSRQARARGRLRDRLVRRGLAPSVALAMWESVSSATAAPPARIVQATVGAAQWFAARGMAPLAGAVPAGAISIAELILKEMVMTKLKVTGVVAVLGLSAAVGVAAVRGQEGPFGQTISTDSNAVITRPGPTAPSAEKGPAGDQGGRMQALEEKLDRLIRVLERSAASPALAPQGADAIPPKPSTPGSAASLYGQRDSVRFTPDRPNAYAKPTTDLHRLENIERRLATVEHRLDEVVSRLQQPASPGGSQGPRRAQNPDAPPFFQPSSDPNSRPGGAAQY